MLPKKYRLPKEKFQYVYKNGIKLRGRFGMLVYLKDSSVESPKLGIVVSKKIGNAVRRHRMTRLVRNVFTDNVANVENHKLPALLQYIAFEFCDDYSELKKELDKQLEKALR